MTVFNHREMKVELLYHKKEPIIIVSVHHVKDKINKIKPTDIAQIIH